MSAAKLSKVKVSFEWMYEVKQENAFVCGRHTFFTLRDKPGASAVDILSFEASRRMAHNKGKGSEGR